MKGMRYAVIYETGEGPGVSAYAPDLPGCVATGKTLRECKKRMAEAIPFHIEGLKRHGLPVPKPTSLADYLEVEAA
jgi:predicted RNase H-like HicB family nuclease